MKKFDKDMFKSEIIEDPKNIVSTIIELSTLLEESDSDLRQLKEMSFLEKILSKDIEKFSNILIKQNDAMNTFLNVIQGMVFVNMTNISVMDDVLSKLSVYKGDKNEYIELAKNYIQNAIRLSKRSSDMLNNHEKILSDLKVKILNKNIVDKKQDELISAINYEIDTKKELDKRQNKLINELLVALNSKEEVDKRQDLKINKIIELLKLKFKTDSEQSTKIRLMQELIMLQNNRISLLEDKVFD